MLELNYSDYSLERQGLPGLVHLRREDLLPSAPDPTRVGYGQSYAGVDMRTRMASARIKHDINPHWHLVVGVLNQDATRDINTPVNNLTDNAGNYISSFANGFAPRFIITSDVGYLNGTFSTGGLGHDLTFGTAGYKSRSYSVITPATPASVLLGTANIDSPRVFPEPAGGPAERAGELQFLEHLPAGPQPRRHHSLQRGLVDPARGEPGLVPGRQLQRPGARRPATEITASSPTASLMFKPAPNMTAYVTYASSLQAGDLAPGTGAANAGASLRPYRSKEYEVGIQGLPGEDRSHRGAVPHRAAVRQHRSRPTTSSRSPASRSTRAWSCRPSGRSSTEPHGLRRRDVPECPHGGHAAA